MSADSHLLNKDDQQELNHIALELQSEQSTIRQASQYILQYRHTTPNSPSPFVAKCALLLAEKSQQLYDVKGQLIRGTGVSLNPILKAEHNIE